jgi:S1-C subfamily serine protease
MLPKLNQTSATFALLSTALLCSLAFPAAAGDDDDLARLLADKEPGLVTIKFVLKMKMGAFGGDQESENEATGVMVRPDGLVLCSNVQLGGIASMIQRVMGSQAGDFSATPTDIKVLIGDDTEGVDAEIVARDTELDLAWVRISDPREEAYAYVDFSKSAEVELGTPVVAVRRMGKYFGRVAVISDGRIGGITKKPRDLYVPSGNFAGSFGVPIFTADGRVVGMTVMQVPDAEDMGANPMSMFGSMSGMQDMAGGFILPAATVAKATRRALEAVEAD